MLIAGLSAEWLSAMGALISSIFAGIAVVAAIIIHCKTRSLLKPFERPIFTAIDNKCLSKLNKEKREIEISITIQFKNVGKNPAEKLTTTVWVAPIDRPKELQIINYGTNANRIEPETTYCSFNNGRYRAKSKADLDTFQKTKMFLCYQLGYYDAYKQNSPHRIRLYYTYRIGSKTAEHATIDEKNRFSPYLKN